MDNPFLPALICFGPFFLLMFVFVVLRRGREVQKVPPIQIAIAFVALAGTGIAGAFASFLLP